MPEPVAVLHSTESATFEQARNTLDPQPGKQPHWLFDPRTGQEHEYIKWPKPAKALRNPAGGVETNNRPGGVLQVELVLYAADAARKAEAWYEALGEWLVPKLVAAGIALEVPYPWVASPIPKGTDPHLTGEQWYALRGAIGHQRVPENDHSDPGDLSRLNKYLVKESPMPTPLGIAQLGPAMATLEELYLAHRAQAPSTDERHAWRQDMLAKARKGEDLESTLAYVDWSLGQER